MSLGAFTTMTFLTRNSFLDEIRKQYVMTAQAKGLGRAQVLYGHVFRNAMLLIIAGFPGAFIHAFFSGALLIETIFSLDGLGLLSFESVDQPRLSRGVCQPLHFRPASGSREPGLGFHLHAGRSAHRLRDARGLSVRSAPARRCRSRSRSRRPEEHRPRARAVELA